MFKIVTLTAAVALVVAFGVAGTAQAATLVVDDDGLATTADCNNLVTVAFTSIQVGVTAASAGDTVFVCPGTYNESVVISTDDITLKGQAGAIIDGTGLGANGITLSGVSGVTIEDFEIRNHGGGLWNGGVSIILINASNNHVKGNTISDSHNAGIVLWSAGDNIVEENEISGSTTGIRLFYASNHNEIRKNEVSGSSTGIGLSGSAKFGSPSDNIVGENTISTNAGFGIIVQGAGASGNLVRGNDISGTFSDGIALWAPNNIAERNVISGGGRFSKAIHISANDTVVKWNEIDGSGLHGIHLQGNGNVVKWNDISAGRNSGIFLFFNDNNVVEWNDISGSTVSGILVQGISRDRKPNDNVIRWNQISGSGFYGIRLLGGASRNLIKENTVTGSGTKDLFHDGSSTPNKWKDNTCGSESGADIPPC